MLNSEKIATLNKLASEDELRTELLIPLLRKMSNFSEVLDNQGSNEAGVDVIGVSSSPFKKPEYTAFILKKGNITLKAADRTNNVVNIIETQIRQAIIQPLTHPRLVTDRAFASRWVVLTNGTISKQAEEALRRAFVQRADISLDFIAQDRLIETIDEYWPEFYEDRRPFLSSYAKKLFDSLDVIDLELLGYSQATKSLSDIYIDTLLVERDSIRNAELIIDKEPILGQNLCKQKKDLVIVTSGPGGGKSTLLKELAISQSQNGHDYVAVYMHARRILSADSVVTAAAEALCSFSDDKMEVVTSEIEGAKLLLLVDGLDELASIEDREKVLWKLTAAVDDLGARVVVGSRPDSNPRVLAALSNFTAYSISPMRYGQIRSFFGKWFKNPDKAVKLLDAMRDKGVMEKLPRTPMTMTLVAIVFESKEDLPSNLTELYEMFVELLTGKWDASRKVRSEFDSPMKVAFLSYLAGTMHQERLELISEDRAIVLAGEFFRDQATLRGVDPRKFIQDIIDRSHIIVPSGDQQLRFSHMTFQEFFAAEHFYKTNPSNEVILDWYGDDWWTEVLFFIAGKRKNISPIVDLLLTDDHLDPASRLTKFVTLGSMLQAGFLTHAASKERAIEFASRNFLRCYDDLVAAIEQAVRGKVRHKYSRVLIIDFLQQLFASNYTSRYLKDPLERVFEILNGSDDSLEARFLLACSLEKLGSSNALLDFASDPRMIDTSMFLISEAMLSKDSLEGIQRDKYKKLSKRKSIFRKAIRREFRSVLKLPAPVGR